MNVVIPLAKILGHELTMKLETEVKLKFDSYPLDMVSRAQVVSKLSQIEGLSTDKILSIVGLLDDA